MWAAGVSTSSRGRVIASLLTLLVGITDISKTSDYFMDASVLLMGAGILLPCVEDIVINPQK